MSISLDDARSDYCAYRQGQNQDLHEYLKEFQALVQVLEHYGVAIGEDGPFLDSVEDLIEKVAPDEPIEMSFAEKDKYGLALWHFYKKMGVYTKKSKAAAKMKSIAIAFLKRADRKCYRGLWCDLENSYTK